MFAALWLWVKKEAGMQRTSTTVGVLIKKCSKENLKNSFPNENSVIIYSPPCQWEVRRSPHNISGASQQNNFAAFSNWSGYDLKKEEEEEKNLYTCTPPDRVLTNTFSFAATVKISALTKHVNTIYFQINLGTQDTWITSDNWKTAEIKYVGCHYILYFSCFLTF